MRHIQALNTQSFLDLLAEVGRQKEWRPFIRDNCILLYREGSDHLHSPLTAVYHMLTGIELHRGSFWQDEITARYHFPWWEVLEISFATISYLPGINFSIHLREKMLLALNIETQKR